MLSNALNTDILSIQFVGLIGNYILFVANVTNIRIMWVRIRLLSISTLSRIALGFCRWIRESVGTRSSIICSVLETTLFKNPLPSIFLKITWFSSGPVGSGRSECLPWRRPVVAGTGLRWFMSSAQEGSWMSIHVLSFSFHPVGNINVSVRTYSASISPTSWVGNTWSAIEVGLIAVASFCIIVISCIIVVSISCSLVLLETLLHFHVFVLVEELGGF